MKMRRLPVGRRFFVDQIYCEHHFNGESTMTTITMPPPRIGRVALAVSDLERSVRFYEDVIGLTLIGREGETARMGAGEYDFLQLHGQPGARPVQQAAGLYHFAILVPSRHDLARTLYHLLQNDGPISGFADHNVSEAIYLTDPDGHGIEIYRDRPRSEWVYRGGQLQMATDPIDLHGILGELRGGPAPSHRMAAGTFVGHIHLQVAQIPATEQFYKETLGMDLLLRYGQRATFMSYNGYHHHLGANTWAGDNLPPAPEDAARLLWFEIVRPAGAAAGEQWFTDPSGIRVLLAE